MKRDNFLFFFLLRLYPKLVRCTTLQLETTVEILDQIDVDEDHQRGRSFRDSVNMNLVLAG